jgi:signal transduction histidine kinase
LTNPADLLGKTDLDLHLPDLAKKYYADERAIFESGQSLIDHEEVVMDREIGQMRWLLTTKVPFQNKAGKIVGLVGVGRDITERKRIEEELRQHREHLEELVEARTRELQEAQEQLIRQEKLAVLGQMAGSVAHELRNPLGILSNSAYFLKMALPDDDETVQEHLEIISAEIRKSDKIISDLLSFSRTRPAESAEREEVAVAVMITQVLAEQPPPAQVAVSTQIAPDLPAVFVDSQQIRQVLTNLASNAYQAMPDGGKLTIKAQTDADEVVIAVSDTGVGIPPENINKLFEPLFTTKAKGIGLGLAVSKNLVEANDGTISIESEAGKGSTFTITLPVIFKYEKKNSIYLGLRNEN